MYALCPSLISTPSPTSPFLCAPKSKLVPLALNWTIMVDGIQSEVLQYTDLYVTNMECLSLIAEGDLTRLELNNLDRWEMLVFSGCLLNQCCTNYDFNIRMYTYETNVWRFLWCLSKTALMHICTVACFSMNWHMQMLSVWRWRTSKMNFAVWNLLTLKIDIRWSALCLCYYKLNNISKCLL